MGRPLTEETDENLSWKCQKCCTISTRSSLLNDVNNSFLDVEKRSVKSCKSFINRFESLLHPNHHLLVAVKLALIDIFAWDKNVMSLSKSDLSWVIKTSKEMFVLVDTLAPAENRLKGVLLYQLYNGLMEERRRSLNEDVNLNESEEILKVTTNFALKN